MTRKPKAPPRTIVVSNNRPKIAITSNEDDHMTLMIPGVTRFSLSLAHSILAAFLAEIDDTQFDDLAEPRIGRGERSLCVVVSFELRVGLRLGTPDGHHRLSKAASAVRRAKLAPLTKALVDVARRSCKPIGGVAVYDVVETTFAQSAARTPTP